MISIQNYLTFRFDTALPHKSIKIVLPFDILENWRFFEAFKHFFEGVEDF